MPITLLTDVADDEVRDRQVLRKDDMQKLTIAIGLTLGSILGGYLPVVLFHVSSFSWLSLVCGFIGCLVGIWLGWKLTLWIEE
jgi:hypothetical protein